MLDAPKRAEAQRACERKAALEKELEGIYRGLRGNLEDLEVSCGKFAPTPEVKRDIDCHKVVIVVVEKLKTGKLRLPEVGDETVDQRQGWINNYVNTTLLPHLKHGSMAALETSLKAFFEGQPLLLSSLLTDAKARTDLGLKLDANGREVSQLTPKQQKLQELRAK